MKIGILTLYYNNHNYGGQLQAYALCNYMNKMKKVCAEQISYNYKEKKKKKRTIKTLLYKIFVWTVHFSTMCRLRKRRKTFLLFEEEIPHSEIYTSNSLKKSEDNYDYIFVGSDQVWNMDFADKNYFLTWLNPCKRCAYAASFGKNRLEKLEKNVLDGLKEYSFLTVREDEAQRNLKQVGIDNCLTVCDPTILLNTEEWLLKIRDISSQVEGEYLFVYLLGGDSKIRAEIKKFAKKNGLEIVTIPHIHFSYQKKDKGFANQELYDVGPWEFLKLINEASYIITDSFHCCVFSILFQKKFWAVNRSEIESTNSRLNTLLRKVNLSHRFVEFVEGIDLEEEIYYDEVEKKLDNYRRESKNVVDVFLQ